METAFHATTLRMSEFILEADGAISPDASERFEHVFVFDDLPHAQAFVAAYPGNFADTGPVILELDVRGVAFEPDPQVPPLPGAFRTESELANERVVALFEPAPEGWRRRELRAR